MLNKFYKTIHNKYSTFFKFIFFLRYLFVIFFISLVLFIVVPNFFDYQKKKIKITDYLYKNYNFKVKSSDDINFKSLPIPRIEIKNVETELNEISDYLYTNKLIIYPKLFSIYNYDKFQVSKIILDKSTIKLDVQDLKSFLIDILNKNKNFSIKDLDIILIDDNSLLVDLNKINFKNHGHKKNLFSGILFDKRFKIEIKEELKVIKTEIPEIGFYNEIKLDQNKEGLIKGYTKFKLLNTNLRFDFLYTNSKFKIFNSYFRNKDLSFKNRSLVTLYPFFNIRANFIIEDFSTRIFEKFNFKKFITYKDFIKKINIESKLEFKSKKFDRNIINDLDSNINFEYGRLNYKKKFKINENSFECKGLINFLEELPILEFDCFVSSNDKRKLLNIFSIKHNNKNEIFELKFKGYINLNNNKVNFKSISTRDYNASKEDLKYFKSNFEKILFDENFLRIFDLKKIKEFILEVS